MKTYGIDDAKVIIRDFLENWVEFKSDGVHLNSEMLQYDTSQVLHWKYVCELENPDAPNPLTAPALPFPFTANELTAYMLDGLGACITSIYGNWEDGPDQAMLDSMGVLGREPRRAITDAYGAFKAAQATVGSYPAELQKRANCLCKTYSYQEDEANEREGVFADGVTPDEANARRARAIASNAKLKRRYSLAKKKYQAAFGAWRKAMVCQLLQPAPAQTPATTAPVKIAERRTWWDVSSSYMVEVMRAGQHATAKELFNALEAKAGTDSPFEKGTGSNRFGLYIRELATPLALKTVQNNWQKLLQAAAQK